ncbi:helix-turn-helix transcriptional regulator [Embleya scabrispora]|uniref:helix-turn-helix transcriptional regulator n=1 Tax=Embleya scabrispora TaxID=159449 RepID=UPI00037E11D2|nr:AraC family transcriptional regulator [Embleya scabrispora]MYS81566.1 helix-turn-helix domain-containing protein [Streptomyces sp. SID5474]
MVAGSEIVAWRPSVAGVSEVLHAHMTDHSYPMHTHAAWTLLIVDDGMVKYDLDRHEHGVLRRAVSLLPPHIPHNGSAATPTGFRKRVLYLDSSHVADDLIGRAVDHSVLDDHALHGRVHRLHTSLLRPGEELEAESRLAFIAERLRGHLLDRVAAPAVVRDAGLAHRLRDLLDARFVEGVTLGAASELLHAHPTHLVRAFGREFGVGPHQYLTGRRVDLARGLLLDGMPPHTVAVTAGFYDQSHLNRHFKRALGISPGRFARTGAHLVSAARPTTRSTAGTVITASTAIGTTAPSPGDNG